MGGPLDNPLLGEPEIQIQIGVQRFGIYPEIVMANHGGPLSVDALRGFLVHTFRLTPNQTDTVVAKIREERPDMIAWEAP